MAKLKPQWLKLQTTSTRTYYGFEHQGSYYWIKPNTYDGQLYKFKDSSRVVKATPIKSWWAYWKFNQHLGYEDYGKLRSLWEALVNYQWVKTKVSPSGACSFNAYAIYSEYNEYIIDSSIMLWATKKGGLHYANISADTFVDFYPVTEGEVESTLSPILYEAIIKNYLATVYSFVEVKEV